MRPSFRQWPAVLGIPWLVDAPLQSLPPSSYVFVRCVCLCVLIFSLLPRIPVTGIEHDLILTTSAMTLFPRKVTCEVLAVRTSTYLFWERDFNLHCASVQTYIRE